MLPAPPPCFPASVSQERGAHALSAAAAHRAGCSAANPGGFQEEASTEDEAGARPRNSAVRRVLSHVLHAISGTGEVFITQLFLTVFIEAECSQVNTHHVNNHPEEDKYAV